MNFVIWEIFSHFSLQSLYWKMQIWVQFLKIWSIYAGYVNLDCNFKEMRKKHFEAGGRTFGN